jgi:HEAT repeat protein
MPTEQFSMTNFYDLPSEERKHFSLKVESEVLKALQSQDLKAILIYSADRDTYVRKLVYQSIGRIYHAYNELRTNILLTLKSLLSHPNEKVRQTAVYSLGEIADFDVITDLLEIAMRDRHHSVRNGVIGALKPLGTRDPTGTLAFARKHLHDPDSEVRRQMIHGVELYGRTHPQKVLPLLKELQNDSSPRVRAMIAHILSQISYKTGCLEIVLADLKTWENRPLVTKAVKEILKVHTEQTYCVHNLEEARTMIQEQLGV